MVRCALGLTNDGLDVVAYLPWEAHVFRRDRDPQGTPSPHWSSVVGHLVCIEEVNLLDPSPATHNRSRVICLKQHPQLLPNFNSSEALQRDRPRDLHQRGIATPPSRANALTSSHPCQASRQLATVGRRVLAHRSESDATGALSEEKGF